MLLAQAASSSLAAYGGGGQLVVRATPPAHKLANIPVAERSSAHEREELKCEDLARSKDQLKVVVPPLLVRERPSSWLGMTPNHLR